MSLSVSGDSDAVDTVNVNQALPALTVKSLTIYQQYETCMTSVRSVQMHKHTSAFSDGVMSFLSGARSLSVLYILLLKILDLPDKNMGREPKPLALPLLYYLRLQIEDLVSRLDIFTIKPVSLSTLISSLEVINNV